MNIYEHSFLLWKDDVKNLLNTELEFYTGLWNQPTFKINDIVMEITAEQFQDMFTSGPKSLPNYPVFGKILVKQYNILKQKQILLEQADAGIGCA